MFNFGNSGGLLKQNEEDAVNNDAMLQASLALLAAGGPSLTPTSFGQNIAQALNVGRTAYQNGANQTVTNAQNKAKIAEAQRQEKVQIALLDAQSKMPDEIKRLMGGTVTPQMALSNGGGPTNQNAAMIGQQFSSGMNEQQATAQAYRNLAAQFATIDPAKAESYLKVAEQLNPKNEVQSVQEFSVAGTPKKFAVFKDGTTRELGVAVEDLISVDLGGKTVLVGKNTAKQVGIFGKSMTPDAMASNEIAKGNLSVNQSRLILEKDKFNFEKGQNKQTEAQANASGFADRMFNSERILSVAKAPSGIDNAASSVPYLGSTLSNFTMNPEQQQFRQAADDWIRAKLRKESGAAIGKEEMEKEYQTYFPQIGDSPQVIEQKASARRIAANAMVRSSGNGYSPYIQPLPENLKPVSDSALLKRYGVN